MRKPALPVLAQPLLIESGSSKRSSTAPACVKLALSLLLTLFARAAGQDALRRGRYVLQTLMFAPRDFAVGYFKF